MPTTKENEKVLTLLQQGPLYPLLTRLKRTVFSCPRVLQLLCTTEVLLLFLASFAIEIRKDHCSGL